MFSRTLARGVGLAAALSLVTVGAAGAATPVSRLTVRDGRASLRVTRHDAVRVRAAVQRSRAGTRRVEGLRVRAGLSHGRRSVVVLTRHGGFWSQSVLSDVTSTAPKLVVTENYGFGVAYYQPYTLPSGQQLYSDTTDVFDRPTNAPGTHGTGSCGGGPGEGESYLGPEWAQALFGTAGYTYNCNAPDDNGHGGSPASAAGFPRAANVTLVSSGFRCEATVGEGAAGHTPVNVDTRDSGEDYQSYTDLAGQPVASINTTCAGVLPAGATLPATGTPNQVACSQVNPFGTGYVRGYGMSYTATSGDFVESCNYPDYPIPTS